ncbi:glycosyltransferase [Marinilactibacillus piezotolerans]|uniref:glycosyltransferase n=1 Tax=Marinilactibacillus piezotolerans TaxID=258723 RepID=UPI0009AF3BB6|nr:glycosyltransferase [Marinilactibacillus piezotolerans]
MKLGIVILNYLNWKDTIECVDSLLQQSKKDIEVVIVDNHSNNESKKKISEYCSEYEHITVIETTSNVGFAKGNNTGIKFLKDEKGIFNIFVCNNDVIFNDQHFFEKLSRLEIDKQTGAIGTTIIGSDGKNQNPVKLKIDFYTLVKHLLEPLLMEIGFSKVLANTHRLVQKIKKSKSPKESTSQVNSKTDSPSHPYLLHGAAIYFTENYLKKSDGFYPETFLYYEENILGIVFEKLGLNMLYLEKLALYHKEDQSMALSFSDVSKAKKKLLRQSIITAMKVRLMNLSSINKKLITKYTYNIIK